MSEDKTPPEDRESTSRDRRVSQLFLKACELDAEQRDAFLDGACSASVVFFSSPAAQKTLDRPTVDFDAQLFGQALGYLAPTQTGTAAMAVLVRSESRLVDLLCPD